MTNNTKQSEETYIRWSVNMNSGIEVGQIEPEPILTIHPDGRVTTSSRLKPDEISALVLDQIKTAWLKDAQATKIRELQDRIKRLEEAIQERDKEWFQVIESILGFHPVSMTEALRIGIERIKKQNQRIKRLEEALEGTVKWIVHLADSGDAGFWDVEKQSEIIAARAALKKESKP